MFLDMVFNGSMQSCMRLLASIVISPHVKGRITPEKLLPFPWEKEKQTQQRVPVSKEEAKSRFERLVKNL